MPKITAAAVMILAEQGKLSVQDPITKFPPDYPTQTHTITRERDKLMTQASGQEKVEIYPESETKFFLKVVDAQITFVVGPDGVATELILNQGGVTMKAKKR